MVKSRVDENDKMTDDRDGGRWTRKNVLLNFCKTDTIIFFEFSELCCLVLPLKNPCQNGRSDGEETIKAKQDDDLHADCHIPTAAVPLC